MEDRRPVCGARWRGTPVKIVIEDKFDRAVGAGADLDGALGCRFEPLNAIGRRQPDYAQAGAKSLFGMRSALSGLRCSRTFGSFPKRRLVCGYSL